MTALANTKLDDFPEDFTLEDLKRGLTPQEVEAIQADPEVALADASAPAAEAAADATPAPAAQPAPVQQPEPPKIEIPDTREAVAKIEKADADLAALTERYDSGELTRAELLAETKAIVAEQAKAQMLIEQAQQVQTQVARTMEQQWFATGDAFKAAGNEILWSPDHVRGWDQALRTVSGTPDYQNLPMDRQYELARDFYAADYKARTGQALPVGTKTAAPATDPDGIPAKPRTDPRDPPVQTLAGVNGDASSMVTDGTFASIMRMMDVDPIQAEDMIRALPEAAQKRFFEEV